MNQILKKDGLVARIVDDETVILDPETGYLHVLNDTGTEIWNYIQKEKDPSVSSVISYMQDTYKDESEPATIENETIELLNSFVEKDLISLETE